MPGPPPNERRRRRNTPTGGDWILLPLEPYAGAKPRMPRGLSEASKAAWRAWWTSPMAYQWIEADWGSLVFLIRLIDEVNNTQKLPRASTLAEIRAWGDLYGLSPKSRRALRWRIETDDAEAATTVINRWADLRVVD